jgi:hypothetical protein
MRLALCLVVVAVSGCYSVNASLPGTLRADVKTDQTEKVGSLDVQKTNWFFVAGLFGAAEPDFFAREIKEQVQKKGADGVANLVYESEFSCGDIFITGITAGCVAPRTFHLTGDVVRIRAARLPGKPAKAVLAPSTTTPERVVAQGY